MSIFETKGISVYYGLVFVVNGILVVVWLKSVSKRALSVINSNQENVDECASINWLAMISTLFAFLINSRFALKCVKYYNMREKLFIICKIQDLK